MSDFFNIELDLPSLVYPTGGEFFWGDSINIQWIEPQNLSPTDLIWYEIFITDDYENNNFIKIANIPYGKSSYLYKINKNIRGEKCRIAIRCINKSGIRGGMVLSSNNFSIFSKLINSPVMIEPTPGREYFNYIPFIFDNNISNSNRAFYRIYVKSDLLNLDWKLIKDNIFIGSGPVYIDVSSYDSSTDYIFKMETVENNYISKPCFIDKVSINNSNFFIIDTVPPDGIIKVVDNNEYMNSNSVVINLDSSDATTGVKEVRIEQYNFSGEETVPSQFFPMSDFLSWDIKGEKDGVKLIQARFKDYGDNVVENDENVKYFRTYKNIDNRVVSAMLYYDGDLYAAYTYDGSEEGCLLYKNLSLLFTLEQNVTALGYYNDALYIATEGEDNKGLLSRVSGSNVEEIVSFSLNSLYSSDSLIVSMAVYNDLLFLGLKNGELLSFDGSSVFSQNSSYKNMRSISLIKSDNNLLYICFDNSLEVLVMRKDSDNVYSFSVAEMEF